MPKRSFDCFALNGVIEDEKSFKMEKSCAKSCSKMTAVSLLNILIEFFVFCKEYGRFFVHFAMDVVEHCVEAYC